MMSRAMGMAIKWILNAEENASFPETIFLSLVAAEHICHANVRGKNHVLHTTMIRRECF
jgi:hypothetical protein